MKKFLFSSLLVASVGMSTNPVFAEEIKPEKVNTAEVFNENEIQQEEIDRRMGIVFDYLDKHANEVDFNGRNSIAFEIPVAEDVIVNAEISHQEDSKARARSTYDVKANTSYIYTLTVKNVVGSGDSTVFTVNYTVGSPVASGKDTYWLTVTNTSVTGTAPSGFDVGSKDTWIGNTNGNIIVDTGGYIKYTRTLLSDKTLNFSQVRFGSVAGSKVVVDYSYSVN